ncbi:uncharacterized protein LOC131025816 [Salvia miltiorrhiza]|uniref:uncharacterized protein LOC131025816 n=1 Tax=Salvia miltiorrhiza TaxID=226208 RepID=UPI0025AB6D39|nr:uncharacterized protein LOC131025816 [Salvia miltiorrhiza]
MNNKLVSSKWIAKRYVNVFRIRNNITIPELRDDIWRRFATKVARDRLYKAMSIAQQLVRRTVTEHYGLVRSYIVESRRVDPTGRFELITGEGRVFKALYMGYTALRKGFQVGCRRILGLDGCFLKTCLGRILLSAVAKDDLEITDGQGWTFLSDQQKGLENVVATIVSHAEHRNCARHVYMNWKKQGHTGSTLKNIFWRAVKASYKDEYKRAMEEMKAESVAAYQDFREMDVHRFCKAFLPTTTFSYMIDNNIAETFNGYIINARGKMVIHILEEIRTSIMVRQVKKLETIGKVTDTLCPEIRKKLEKLRWLSRHCIPYPVIGGKFEVLANVDKFVVDVEIRTCSCRMWQLIGIPCVHGICSIQYMGLDVGNFVADWYGVDRYKECYKFGLPPLNGQRMWPEVGDDEKVKPPLVRSMPGRTKKKKRRALEEKDPKNPNKLKRHGQIITCNNCNKLGHNSRTCTKMTVVRPPKEQPKRGRPRKKADKDATSTTIRQESSQAIAAREMNFAKTGAGVYTSLGTGNIYYHMPQNTKVTHVNSANKGSGTKGSGSKISASKGNKKATRGPAPMERGSEGPTAPNVGMVNTQESGCSTGDVGAQTNI